jgi:hypothetical protein
MRPIAFALISLLSVKPVVAQQCALDLNNDKRTSIDELIVAINQALNGCPGGVASTPTPKPTPTPTPVDRCTLNFNDNNAGQDFCTYIGTLSASCITTEQAASGWQSNGSTVAAILIDNTGSLGFTATRTSATTARITAVAAGPDFTTEEAASGMLTLPSAKQFNLSTNPSTCTNFSFKGTFNSIVSPTSQSAGTTLGAVALSMGGSVTPTGIADLLTRFQTRHSGGK